MNNTPLTFEERIAQAAKQPALSASERTQMRAMLEAHMRLQGALQATTPSPYIVFFHRTLAVFSRPAPAFIAALLILTVTVGGVAHASENTLPGDTLYPLKVHVVEPIQVAFSFSTEAKNNLRVTLAERRITEGATLAHEGRLSTSTENMLAVNFAQNASAATATSTASLITFDAKLTAYQTVLMHLDAQRGTHATQVLQNAIQAQIALDASNTASRGITVASVRILKDAAEMALGASAHVVNASATKINTPSSVRAKNSYQEAQTFSLEGNTFLEHNDTEGASNAFLNVLSTTAQLDVLARAAAQFDIDTFATTTASTTQGTIPVDASTTGTTGTTGTTVTPPIPVPVTLPPVGGTL